MTVVPITIISTPLPTTIVIQHVISPTTTVRIEPTEATTETIQKPPPAFNPEPIPV